jgi:beta-fructofuranosidase
MPHLARPLLHIRPDRGWLNDPNGVCRVDGVYHVFYQHNPGEPIHGNIHWGHASSTDLLRWHDNPVALSPSPGGVDAGGCWSGCIVDDDGVPTAVYTAVLDHAGNAGVVLARSDRTLQVWQAEDAVVTGTPVRAGVEEVRDPFVFSHDGRRYAIQGAGARSGRPQLLLYACDDLRSWTELSPLLTDDDPVAAQVAQANLWECPNLALIDRHWVLLISVWRWRDDTHELAGVRYLLGDLRHEGDGLRFRAESGGELDVGPAFYAPQLLVDGTRTLLWGWAWEVDQPEPAVRARGWAGVVTFPRELSVRAGRLHSAPARELLGLRRERVAEPNGGPFEVVTAGAARLYLVDGAASVEVAGTDGAGRIFVDASMVETFVDGVATTTRAYPTATSRWVLEGPATIYRLGL